MQAKRGKRSEEVPTPEELEAQLAPMQSVVKWAVLGLVIEREDHGYELARRFEDAYGGLLSLSSPSYVYKALGTLERRGWIEALPDDQMRGVRKTCYRAKETGLGAYEGHLIEAMMRFDEGARLYTRNLAAFAHSPQRALEVIERSARVLRAQRDPLHEAGRPTGDSEPQTVAARLYAQARRLALTASIEWFEEARREIEALARKAGVPEDNA